MPTKVMTMCSLDRDIFVFIASSGFRFDYYTWTELER
jgi:hypothetical protein